MSNLFKIVLDAGHGGKTPVEGSSPNNSVAPNGLLEKDLTLKIAQIVREKLPKDKFQTFLTREKDENLSLRQRAVKSREVGADVFISIHFNGSRKQNFDGTEVFVAESSDDKDYLLAEQLLRNISSAASIGKRGIREVDFTVLKGKYHLAKTAACLIEMAYLTNPLQAKNLSSPNYVDKLASAVTQAIVNYAKQASYAQSLADEKQGEKLFAEVTKEHSDPKNFPIDLPEPGGGIDKFTVEVPKGLKLSRWEVEVLESSTGAGYKVIKSPPPKAEGTGQVAVEWNHLPYGKIKYKFKAYASPDGTGTPEKIYFDSAGWMEKAKDQIAQGVPFQIAVKGEKAKKIYEALRKKQGENAQQTSYEDYSSAMEPVTITVVILVGIVVFGVLVALGLLTLGAIIKMALDKGYNIKDTKYKAGVGEGQLRQDHEIAFNIMRPSEAKAQSFGLDDELDSSHFESLEAGTLENQALLAYGADAETTPLPADCKTLKEKKLFLDYTGQKSNGRQIKFGLVWNNQPIDCDAIDVVVHFHGHNISGKITSQDEFNKYVANTSKIETEKNFFKYVVGISGLDLSLRKSSTIGIIPFGNGYLSPPDPKIDKKDYSVGYNFEYVTDKAGELEKFIDFALNQFAKCHNLCKLRRNRLILTAHSGGGKAVSLILPNAGTNVDEVHLFDAIYGKQYEPIGEWAKKKIATNDGALRAVHRGNKTAKIADYWGTIPTALSGFYKLEKTECGHNDIPKKFGALLLEKADANLGVAQCSSTSTPKLPPTTKQKSLAFYDENEIDYFAESEANFKNL